MNKSFLNSSTLLMFCLFLAISSASLSAESATKENKGTCSSCTISKTTKEFIKYIYPYVGLAAYCWYVKPYQKQIQLWNETSEQAIAKNEAARNFITVLIKSLFGALIARRIKGHAEYLDEYFLSATGLDVQSA